MSVVTVNVHNKMMAAKKTFIFTQFRLQKSCNTNKIAGKAIYILKWYHNNRVTGKRLIPAGMGGNQQNNEPIWKTNVASRKAKRVLKIMEKAPHFQEPASRLIQMTVTKQGA